MAPEFLTLGDVLEIHAGQVEGYGGDPGLRDLSLLKSAIAMPMAGLGGQYLHTSIFEMAAAYLYHICRNHPFVDGDKRTGTVAAIVFLDLNGKQLNCTEDELEELVLAVAEGETDKSEITAFLRRHCR